MFTKKKMVIHLFIFALGHLHAMKKKSSTFCFDNLQKVSTFSFTYPTHVRAANNPGVGNYDAFGCFW